MILSDLPSWALECLQDVADSLMQNRRWSIERIDMAYRYAYEQLVMAVQAGAR